MFVDGTLFVPALSGLGTPHWQPEAKGAFLGITRNTKKSHLARAVLEGVALQICDILSAMQKDLGVLKTIKVDGGASRNNLLMQFQADLLNIACVRPKVVEATAIGTAALAGLNFGIFANQKEFEKAWQEERCFIPKMAENERNKFNEKWQRAVSLTKDF